MSEKDQLTTFSLTEELYTALLREPLAQRLNNQRLLLELRGLLSVYLGLGAEEVQSFYEARAKAR